MAEQAAYEELVSKLEGAVARLEHEPMGLEEALALYEDGHQLLRQAQERLSGLEGRMEKLLADGSRHELAAEGS